eukprot:TRINITY_DN75662_c0_g1_i1.p1 TRINITY_DN75662_c0_g1~~TRINITY_DN75662_c0_g1_i1.p1  ORF type:complete len:137 (+),score=17.02 TRINITY_DN75662_c0_g1_i1:101-511(+)
MGPGETDMKVQALVAVGIAASVASAQRFDMFVYENDDGADISGLDLYFEIFDQGSAIDFVFHNDSTDPAIVTALYFEDAFSGLVNGMIQDESAGVDFEEVINKKQLKISKCKKLKTRRGRGVKKNREKQERISIKE